MMDKKKKVIKDIRRDSGIAHSSFLREEKSVPQFLLRKKGQEPPKSKPQKKPRTKNKFFALLIVAIVAIFIILIIGGNFFARANIKVFSNQEIVELNSTFIADKNNASPEKLSFQVVTIEEKANKKISVSDTKVTERKATGQIVVYNNYSKASQRLVKDTRFETPEGKIYRAKKAFTVPGKRLIDGKNVPGSIEIEVSADKPGQEYNISLTDFTVPGLKNDKARYEGFYARSKTPMTGGFAGEVKIPNEEDKALASQALEGALTVAMMERLQREIPDGFIFFESGVKTDFELENEYQAVVGKSDNSYDLQILGKLSAIIFDHNLFSQFIASRSLSNYSGEDVKISNYNDINFALLTKSADIEEIDTVSFKVDGPTVFVWDVDKDALKEAVSGQRKSKYKEIFANFPNIRKATVKISPFWKRTFPANPEKISIERAVDPVRD